MPQGYWPRWKGKPSGKQVGLRYGFRSGLEEKNAEHIKAAGLKVSFEEIKIKYAVPAIERTYTPDFELPNGIIVETKGRFLPVDMAKLLYVKTQHPELDIRMVFNNPNARNKGRKFTYADWCESHGFKYAKGLIPVEWMKEPRRGDGPTGARTIALSATSKDLIADSARQPYSARGRKSR